MRVLNRVVRSLIAEGRWRRSLALVVVFALGCGLLSWWQFSRRAETAAANAVIAANAGASPAPLDELLPTPTSWSPRDEWRTVEVRGAYLTDRQLLVRTRVQNDQPGFEVLTPMRLENGRVLVLDRGWVPTGTKQDKPDSVPAAPSGTVTVQAYLQADEGPLAGRTAPPGEIPSVDLKTIAADLPGSVYTGAYGLVRSQDPAPATTPLQLGPEPASLGVDEGTHLSYAVQWILFALLGFAGLFWTIRRDLLDAGDPVVAASEARRTARRAKAPASDESVEDALLDR